LAHRERKDHFVKVVSAGIDWITITQRPGDEMDQLRSIALAIADSEHHMGMFGRPWSASGYEGFGVGHMEYGERHDGCILQLHSHLSHAHWKRVFELARNVSRLDVEVTLAQDEDPLFTVRRHLRQMQRFNKQLKRPAQLEYKVSHNGGMTIYSGSPKSDLMLRIYDKQRESNLAQWSNSVRYECQFRRKPSLKRSLGLSRSGDLRSSCAGILHPILVSRGCLCPGVREFAKGVVSLETALLGSGPSDRERVCTWLRKSVAPSVQRLLQYTDREILLDVLGLSASE